MNTVLKDFLGRIRSIGSAIALVVLALGVLSAVPLIAPDDAHASQIPAHKAGALTQIADSVWASANNANTMGLIVVATTGGDTSKTFTWTQVSKSSDWEGFLPDSATITIAQRAPTTTVDSCKTKWVLEVGLRYKLNEVAALQTIWSRVDSVNIVTTKATAGNTSPISTFSTWEVPWRAIFPAATITGEREIYMRLIGSGNTGNDTTLVPFVQIVPWPRVEFPIRSHN